MIRAEDLDLPAQAALLTGADFWTTAAPPGSGVAPLTLTDGPHGVRRQAGAADHLGLNDAHPATCFPPAVAVGSSWDPDLAARIGAALGVEAAALGVAVLLGPGVNIKRHPLCGRNFEYYAEDPLLTAELAIAHIRALQERGVGASIKHFAANNQETDRMRISAEVDERTLREIYFPAFERAVTEASPATVMCSYNRINGVRAAENTRLLTAVLRDEWGFRGAVVSDWGAVHDPVASVRAGLDLEMPHSPRSAGRLVEAVRAGELDPAAVVTAAQRVLDLQRWRPPAEPAAPDPDAHHRLAREVAADSAVLLRNRRDALPLDPTGTVAVIGEFARTPRYQGGGSSHVNATRVDVPLDEITARAGARGVIFAPGFGVDGGAPTEAEAERLREEAAMAAATADVAVVFAGLTEAEESEGFDRPGLGIAPQQVAVIRAVAELAPRTVVVLVGGGVVDLEPWHDEVDAIVEVFLPGQGGGAAIADLLFGLVNPSGRLAETIPRRLRDTPAYVNFPGEQGTVRYGEGGLVGYRWYETVDIAPRYPFGHGLSYTTFTASAPDVTVLGPDRARASVTVTNTGMRAGKYVVQLYVATDAGPVRRPARALAAFAKPAIEPGASVTVDLELPRRAFAYFDVPLGDWVVPAGRYRIEVGRDSRTVEASAEIELAGDEVVRRLDLESTIAEWADHPRFGPEFRAMLERSAPGMPVEQLLQLAGSMPVGKALDMLSGDDGAARTRLEAVIAGQ